MPRCCRLSATSLTVTLSAVYDSTAGLPWPVPLWLKTSPPSCKARGLFSLLGFGEAGACFGALGWVGAALAGLEGCSFFACGFGRGHHLFTVHHGNLQLAFPSPQAFVDPTVGVFGSFFTGQLLLHALHASAE
jgi:hypothetical protein